MAVETVRAAAGPAMPLKRAPAWLKRPAGVAFGFGNRLVSFKNAARQGHGGEHIETGVISLSQARFCVKLILIFLLCLYVVILICSF